MRMPERFLIVVLACVVSVFAVAEGTSTSGHQEYMVKMRDGVELATSVYLPEGEGPWPAIVTRTPYNKSMYKGQYERYTKEGFAFVAQDARGKFRSKGEYFPFRDDMADGYDTIEWVAAQDFCDGKVGITGASAMGITSNQAMASDPPHLAAAFVVVAPHSRFNEVTFINGVYKANQGDSWMKSQGAGDQIAAIKRRVIMDDLWYRTDFVNQISNVDIPVYNVGGWYDIFLQGNINNFGYLQHKGREGAQGNQKLLMGPFGHGGLGGGLEYDGGSLFAFAEEETRWFGYWLKGEDNGIMDEPAVKYYMMASARKGAQSPANRWVTADNWPPASTYRRYYLGADSNLSLEAPQGKTGSTEYWADPANPVPTVGGSNLFLGKGPLDQRTISDRGDYLRFVTAPLTEDVVIAGRVWMSLYASTDGRDTDFMVKLVDVYPDGYEALVLDNPIRARYRYGRNTQDDVRMMTPNEAEFLHIDLWSTALTFEKGHRIGVHIASSNSPRFEVNPNTGDAPGEEEHEPRVAKNRVYHDFLHPSHIELPVLSN